MKKQQLEKELNELVDNHIFLTEKVKIVASEIQITYLSALIRSIDHGREENTDDNRAEVKSS